MRQALLLKLMLAIVLSLFLVACGNNADSTADEGSDSGSADTGEKVTLKVVSQYGGTDPATEVFQGLLEEFETEHPNVTIEDGSGTASPEFNTRVQTQWSSGDHPDLTFFFADEKGDFIRSSGNVVSMDELLEEDPDWASSFNPAVLDQIRDTQDGELYSLPVNGYYESVIVNKQLFEEAGLELPETWEQFKTAIQTFSETDVIPLSASLVSNPYLIDNFTLAVGGVEGHNEPFSDAYIEGLNLIKESYEWGAYPEDTMTIEDADAQNYFKKGQAAMMINFFHQKLQNSLCIFAYPCGPQQRSCLCYG